MRLFTLLFISIFLTSCSSIRLSPTDAYLRKPIDADARIYVAPNLAILNEILSERIQLQIVEEVKQKSFTTTDSVENATHILTFYFGQSIPLKHDMVKTVETPAAEQEEKVEKADGTIEIVKTKIPASSSSENVSVVTQPRLLVLQVRENTAEKVLVWHSETFSYVASVKSRGVFSKMLQTAFKFFNKDSNL